MVSNTVSGEFVKSWLGRPWIETVADSGVDKVRSSLDDALSGGVSAYRRIVQRFPSGLELPIEYTTVRLAESGGMIAVGRNLQASSELQSRLIAAQQAMERDYWKLREVETRYRLLFDASTEAVLVLNSDDLRVTEANPAAIRALGLTRGWDFLDEMAPPEREAFRAMLDRVREGGRAPGGIFHIGARQAPWIVRASSMSDDGAAFYMVQLVPAEGQRALAAPERGANAAVGSSRAEASVGGDPSAGHAPSIATVSQPTLPALAPAGKTPLKMLVRAAVAVVERHYVESALAITEGNRTAAAERLGLSRQSLYAKLSRYGLDAAKR
jgi:transcriptional regulator PpsR